MLSLPKFSMFAKYPLLMLVTVQATIVAAPIVVDMMAAAKLLGLLFVADMITGIMASYYEWKKIENKKDKWFFGTGEGFSSDKFKKMGVKAIIYMSAPLLVLKFQQTFMIKNLKYETLTSAEITLPVFFILLFCANEGFSIVHENLPACGFSLYKRIKTIAGVYKKTKKELTDD